MTDDPRASIERLALPTPDGFDLRAEISGPEIVGAAVVACHPHPLHGGSMYANVVETLFTGLPPHGAAVLRFNFRGTSGSGGRHDRGRAERLDVTAAVDEVHRRWPDVGVVLAGYSFGADVALAVDHPAVTSWFLVAPPLRVVPIGEMVALGDQRPKRFVVGAHDQYCSYDQLAATVADSPGTTLTRVQGADHFFAVGLDQVLSEAVDALG